MKGLYVVHKIETPHAQRRRWVKFAALIAIATFFGGMLPLGVGGSVSHAAGGWCVNPGGTGGCYARIQAAVNAAPAGSSISVAPGTYKEDVSITKAITLQGAGSATTIIDATGLLNGINLQGASSAKITGFTIENAELAGIQLTNTPYVTIDSNTVQNNDKALILTMQGPACPKLPNSPYFFFDTFDCGEGIHLQGVSYSSFTNNLVQGNSGGLLVTDESGPTHDNLISHNVVRDNILDCGITLPSHPPVTFGPAGPVFGRAYGVYNNTVSNNLSTGNGTTGEGSGIGLFGPVPGTAVYNNKVVGNTVTNNGQGGITFHAHTVGQNLNGNQIRGNTISGNAGDADAGAPPSGIIVFADPKGGAAPIQGTVISFNNISNETDAVFVGRNATSVYLRWNNLGQNTTFGVYNAGTATVNAIANYWGCRTGPGTDGCAGVYGAVQFWPWLSLPVPPSFIS
jgi:parallel beta-helix repeat protein